MGRKKTRIGWLSAWSLSLMVLAVFIPTVLVERSPASDMGGAVFKREPDVELDVSGNPISVPVYLSDEGKVETVPLEAYVRGVVAAEMPIEFELEALKAQAIAARTYIVRRLIYGDESESEIRLDGAAVSDTVTHQAYVSEEQLAKRWSIFEQAANMEKLNRAVNETKGLIATYEGMPIQALYFSTSNGYTEHSEDYFRDPIPYLRSVASPWDESLSPKFRQTITMTEQEAAEALGLPLESGGLGAVQLLESTAGNRVKTIVIQGNAYTGREVREKLNLPSSHFDWQARDGIITLTTYGYGHGVGMSQYGAQGMALAGATAEEILHYYYKGIRIERLEEKNLAQDV